MGHLNNPPIQLKTFREPYMIHETFTIEDKTKELVLWKDLESKGWTLHPWPFVME